MQNSPPRSPDPVVTLKDVLDQTGWTQEEFAARAKVSYGTVNRWLNGRTNLSPRRLSGALTLAGIDLMHYARSGSVFVAPSEDNDDDQQPEWATRLEQQNEAIQATLDKIYKVIARGA